MIMNCAFSSDPTPTPCVLMSVVRTSTIIAAALSLALVACKKDDKSETTPKKTSSGTVTTEDTKLMGDGTDVPDAKGTPDSKDGKGGKDGAEHAKGEPDGKPDGADKKPDAPTIKAPDLDVGAAAQAQSVAKHLETARTALTGPGKDPDRALREARAALTADSTNIDAVVLMAHAYYAKRLYDTAEVMLDMVLKARKKAKNHPGVYHVYGLIYDQTKRPELAMAAYQKAVERRPNFKSALINLGVHYLRNRSFNEAITTYEKLTNQLNVKTPTTWTNLGSAYRGHSGDYPPESSERTKYLHKAEASYKRALGLAKSYANAYYNLGLLYLDAQPFPMPDGAPMDKLKRLERSKTYFEEYRSMSGADLDLVDSRTKQVNKLIKRETKRRKREEKKKKKKKSGDDDDW